MKRVWCLYRVSTKAQVNLEDDIPMQKNACVEFVNTQKDWLISNELYELGVSGWKKNTAERDEITKIKEGAIKGELDILLVFMFDRLGRREDETPLVVNFLHNHNVDVWSVKEGKRNMESHVDKLINYINFWQSSGESLKTSIRVRESKRQLSKQGYFQGGIAPFGYEIYDTEINHWKSPDRKLKELRANTYEANVVNLIYDLYVNRGYGIRRITSYLNENNYQTRQGKKFGVSLVYRILSNSIYIGYRRYKSSGEKETSQPYNKNLHIIPKDLFDKAKIIKQNRNTLLNRQDKTNIPIKGKLLFSGTARCFYCNSKLTSNYLYRKIKKKNGDIYKSVIYRYTCPLNNGNNEHDQSVWGAIKYDKLVIKEVINVMKLIDVREFIEPSISIKQKVLRTKELEFKNVMMRKSKMDDNLEALNREIVKCIEGKSKFTPEQLSSAISNLNNDIEKIKKEMNVLKKMIYKVKQENEADIIELEKNIGNWEELFETADHDLKKALLGGLIETVYFAKNKIVIKFNIYMEEILCEGMKNNH